jgi:hypothetical protein
VLGFEQVHTRTAQQNHPIKDATRGERPALIDRHSQSEEGTTMNKGASQQRAPVEQSAKTYIDVPFKEKDEVKALGARWDRGQQCWYVLPGWTLLLSLSGPRLRLIGQRQDTHRRMLKSVDISRFPTASARRLKRPVLSGTSSEVLVRPA